MMEFELSNLFFVEKCMFVLVCFEIGVDIGVLCIDSVL